MNNATEAFNDILDVNWDTKFEKARDVIKEKYGFVLSRSNYDKIRSVRRKNKKGKNKNKKNTIISPSKKTGTGGSSPPPTQTIQDLKDKIKFYKNLDPDDFLMLGMTKEIEIDSSMFTHYIKQGLYSKQKEKMTQERFVFKEPDWFVPHQSDMYNKMINGNCGIIGMRQLTYKTTTGLCATANKLYEHPESLIVQISTGMDLSKELIGKIDYDHRVASVWTKVLKTSNKESKILINNSRLICRPCKPSSLQGLTGGLWIDELDKIIVQKDTRQALAAALPIVITLLMEGKAFIWFTCNQASNEGVLQFEYFLRVLSEFGNFFPVFRVEEDPITKEFVLVQINNFDIEVPTETIAKRDFFRNMLFKLLAALHDTAFAKAQMLNIYDDSSGMFRAELVANAFEYWSESKIPKIAYNSVMAIDPGHTHATAVIILQQDKDGNLIEVFAKEYFGKAITEEAFKDEVFELYRKYHCREAYVESNSGGKWWRDHWVQRGMNVHLSNFGTANPNTGEVSNMGRAFERTWYERVLKEFLEQGKILLHNERLLEQFSLYNPTDNKERGKGDLVDALLHCCFWAAGGINYLMSLIENKKVMDDDTGGVILF